MKVRQQMAAFAASLVFCAAVFIFLEAYGAAHRTFLKGPVIASIKAPEEAFSVWQKQKLKGRILVLVDRRLNAAPADKVTYEFQRGEFSNPSELQQFCSALGRDLREMAQPDFPCTIDDLNTEVLRRGSLYGLFISKKPDDPTGEITTLAGYMLLSGTFNDRIPPGHNDTIVKLNRLILQRAYPGLCPTKPDYVITPGNYVHQAVMAGAVRKIYHLISDSAWDEVSSVLSSSASVQHYGRGFRFAMAEGVSVTVIRIRDMQSIGEPAVVNINSDSVDTAELGVLPRLFASARQSDLITVSGRQASELRVLLEAGNDQTR